MTRAIVPDFRGRFFENGAEIRDAVVETALLIALLVKRVAERQCMPPVPGVVNQCIRYPADAGCANFILSQFALPRCRLRLSDPGFIGKIAAHRLCACGAVFAGLIALIKQSRDRQAHLDHSRALHDVTLAAVLGGYTIARVVVIGRTKVLFFICGVDHIFHENPAVAGIAVPLAGERIARFERAIEIIIGKEHEGMSQTVKTLIAQAQGRVRVAGRIRLLLELGLARMFAGLCVNFIAANEALDRAVITPGMAGLVTGGERIMDVASETKRFPADGMNDRMTITPQFGVVHSQGFDQLQDFNRGVIIERWAEKVIQALRAA